MVFLFFVVVPFPIVLREPFFDWGIAVSLSKVEVSVRQPSFMTAFAPIDAGTV